MFYYSIPEIVFSDPPLKKKKIIMTPLSTEVSLFTCALEKMFPKLFWWLQFPRICMAIKKDDMVKRSISLFSALMFCCCRFLLCIIGGGWENCLKFKFYLCAADSYYSRTNLFFYGGCTIIILKQYPCICVVNDLPHKCICYLSNMGT